MARISDDDTSRTAAHVARPRWSSSPPPLCRLAAGDSEAVRGDEGRPRARPVNSRHNLPVKDTSNQTRNLN